VITDYIFVRNYHILELSQMLNFRKELNVASEILSYQRCCMYK